MKKTTPVAIALALVALLALGCGASTTDSRTPSQVVKAFFDEVVRNDAAASYKLISATDKKQLSAAEWKKFVQEQASGVTAGGGPVTMNVKSGKTSGKGAVVSVELKQGTDSESLDVVTEKEGGGWKVSLQQSEGLNAP